MILYDDDNDVEYNCSSKRMKKKVMIMKRRAKKGTIAVTRPPMQKGVLLQ